MNSKTHILTAHAALTAVLDAKLLDVPEWKAFKAIDAALVEIAQEAKSPPKPKRVPVRGSSYETVENLAEKLMTREERPVKTSEIVEYVAQVRGGFADMENARVNIASAMSHSKCFRNVSWLGRSWWWADKPIPPTPGIEEEEFKEAAE